VVETWLKAKKTVPVRRLNQPRLVGMQGNPGIGA
jgi:sulfur-oxidizing protein SoxB